MNDESKRGMHMTPDQWRRVLPWLAAALVLLAGWLLVGGARQMQDQSRAVALEQARDEASAATQRAIGDETRRLAARLEAAEVRTALAAGDRAAAGRAIGAGWTGLTRAEVWPADLDALYAALPGSGYGSLAVGEAALASGKPVSRVVQSAGEQRLAVAAPTVDANGPVVAYVEVPMAGLASGIESASLAKGTYLALRQGERTLLERGDAGLAEFAEALASKVPGSDLRIAAALPDAALAPFALGSLPAMGAGALLLLITGWLWFGLRPRLMAGTDVLESGDAPQTLADLQRTQPAPAYSAPRVVGDTRAAPLPVAIDRGIFRAYDIRGVVGTTLDISVAELIGQAVGSLMADKGLDDIVVGRDGRLSGPDMVQGLVAGLRKAGRNVIDIGMAPTPVVYFGCYHLRTGCGIAVTGSHNPPDYNGFKIVIGGETLSGAAITDLYARIAEDRLHEAKTPGTLGERDINDDYVERIAGDIQIGQRLKVVVDAGNGVAGVLGPRVLEAIGAEVVPLFCEIDGTFPNHHPDPSEAHNLEALIQMVARLDADLGIAFDGDGDRLGVVTRAGKNIFPDRLLMLFAADVLQRNPGAVIVYDVKCTGRLPAHILRHGGSPLMWKTGHSLIKAKMRETEAELAGEMSGHFFFAERWYGFDDGIYAAARLLEILDAEGQTPDEVFDSLPDGISTPEIKVAAPGDDPHAFVERFRMAAKFDDGARLSTIDGLRVDWPDGWGLVRASNTTSILVMRFDADSTNAMARIQQAFREQLLALQPDLVLPF
ncbi:MAG: phosphomannomutase/phosphoglucomutase [Pseudomonadota bacterium]